VAACPPTVYRLDAAGEVYEVMLERADDELRLEEAPGAATSAECAEVHFDVTAWWSKQLGGALSAA
jgi:hypothetical protein